MIRRSGTADHNADVPIAYDGDGNRRSKTSGGQTTTYVNDARGLSQVLQATTGATVVTYVPGLAQHDASKPTEAAKWGYSLSDAQNSRLLVDGAGAMAHRWEWEPFGRARADQGTTAAAFSYGGEQKDDETGLINLRARYYDPAIGRFLSRDSLPGVMSVPQSWNRYSYVENDPVNHLDPSGHKKKKIKWPGGQDPDDDSHIKKKAKKCKNPGQYTGSCKGGPPNAAYAADGEAQHEAKRAGQAAASGNLSAAAAHLEAAKHFASIAGTSAAATATVQAFASVAAAFASIRSAHAFDNGSEAHDDPDVMYRQSIYSPIAPSCGATPFKPVRIGCRVLDFTIDHGDEIVDLIDAIRSHYSPDGGGGGGSGWVFNPEKDLDWTTRTGGVHQLLHEAIEEAFRRTGVPRDMFAVTEEVKDVYGKTHAVEWRSPGGGEVNIDRPKTGTEGPPFRMWGIRLKASEVVEAEFAGIFC